MEKIYFVYILKSKKDTLYTGITTDLKRRLSEHTGASPGGAKYMRGFRAADILFVCEAKGRSAAQKIEYYIKSLSRNEKENLMACPDTLFEHFFEPIGLKIWDIDEIKPIREFLKKLIQK
ncbi:MAG: GIY-YIG nuclease family protein [Fusobacteriaceae bacterium]|jgi:putative endonuclease|nr:GIY-YIG nuclease family protein [Fusobacteriaceae bacterium]